MRKLTITYDPKTNELKLNVNNALGGEVVLMLQLALQDFCASAFDLSVDDATLISYQMHEEGELFQEWEENKDE